MTKIIIADDHLLLLKGLEMSIDSSQFEILGTANNGIEGLKLLQENHVDIAVIDIEMPLLDGLNMIKEAKKLKIHTKFILLSYHKEEGLVSYALENPQIFGYLLKEEVKEDINICLKAVELGKTYFSNSIMKEEYVGDLSTRFTPSEKKILKLIAAKHTNSQIAEKLYISERTVEKHRSNIQFKICELNQDRTLTSWVSENKIFILSL